MSFEEYQFKFGNDQHILLKNPPGVFTPTGTTSALVEAASTYIKKPGKLLDLGCGNGVVGIAMYEMGLVEEPLNASDLSEDAVEIMNINAKLYNCSVIAKCGSIFEPWQSEKFDYILNDISGVAKQVADISPWFNAIPSESGEDGTDLIVKMLMSAPNHLNEGGVLFFPVISLSNVDKILEVANNNFSYVEHLSSNEWPLPKEMTSHVNLLDKMASDKLIRVTKKFGLITFYTDIYVAYN
jgi:release factor glutamine methyltransferase